MPTVSVCLPVYKGERYIAAAIDSVLAQTFTDFELVITNEPVQDKTPDIIATYSDPRIRFYQNEQRLGLVGNWNQALSHGTADLLVLMHQDDLMQPDNLAAKVAYLHNNPAAGMVYSNIRQIDADGTVIGGHWLPESQSVLDETYSGERAVQRLLTEGNIICMPSVMFRRTAVSDHWFDPRLAFTCDLEMWLRIASQSEVGYLAAPLIDYRAHADQETSRFSRGQEILEYQQAVEIALLEHYDGPQPKLAEQAYAYLRNWALGMAKWKLKSGDFASGIGYFNAWRKIRMITT